jgi:hypothetical protein
MPGKESSGCLGEELEFARLPVRERLGFSDRELQSKWRGDGAGVPPQRPAFMEAARLR